MLFVLAIYAMAPESSPSTTADVSTAQVTTQELADKSAAETAARQWLLLVDAGKWRASWQATGSSFQKLNSAETWARVSTSVRTPLGEIRSRVLNSNEWVPAPPNGYQMVRFSADFATKPNARETLTLMREHGNWRVVGYIID